MREKGKRHRKEGEKKKRLPQKTSSLSYFKPVGKRPLRLLELGRREGEPGVLVAAEGLELEEGQWRGKERKREEREERERGFSVRGETEKEGKKRKTLSKISSLFLTLLT